MTPDELKGTVITLNGDRWTVVDVAPAEPLAEMVAAILEDEGMVAVVRGADPLDDVYSHLGGSRVGTTVVLVPEADAPRAFDLIAETVTDYQGEELEELLASGAVGVDEIALLEGAGPDDLDELDSDDSDDEDDEDGADDGPPRGAPIDA